LGVADIAFSRDEGTGYLAPSRQRRRRSDAESKPAFDTAESKVPDSRAPLNELLDMR
jgi:hypothetical protein